MSNMQTARPIREISKFPTVYQNAHESILRAWQILERVKEMLQRGDSNQTIIEVIEACENEQA